MRVVADVTQLRSRLMERIFSALEQLKILERGEALDEAAEELVLRCRKLSASATTLACRLETLVQLSRAARILDRRKEPRV